MRIRAVAAVVGLAVGLSALAARAQEALSLSGVPDREILHPGEELRVRYVLRNDTSGALWAVLNPGPWATTIRFDLRPAGGIWPVDRAPVGCRLGEGVASEHFRELDPGDSVEGTLTAGFVSLPPGGYEIRVRYIRAEGPPPIARDPGALDRWEECAVVSIESAVAAFEVRPWNAPALEELADRIRAGEVASIETARVGEVAEARDAMEAFLTGPDGGDSEARWLALHYLVDLGLGETGAFLATLATDATRSLDSRSRVFQAVRHAPAEAVEPWARGLLADARRDPLIEEEVEALLATLAAPR